MLRQATAKGSHADPWMRMFFVLHQAIGRKVSYGHMTPYCILGPPAIETMPSRDVTKTCVYNKDFPPAQLPISLLQLLSSKANTNVVPISIQIGETCQ
jgi:hypothetical protein